MRATLTIVLLVLTLSLRGQKGVLEEKVSEDSLIAYFEDLDLEAFDGKQVDSFLTTLAHCPCQMKVQLSTDIRYSGMLTIYYPYGLAVDVFIQQPRRLNPNGMNQRRNLRLVRSETISAIRVHNELACINGCG